MPSTAICFYLGADISQDHIDVALRIRKEDHSLSALQSIRIDNSKKGFALLHKWLLKASVQLGGQALMVIENTGVYHRALMRWCHAAGLPLYIGNATGLHHSFGIVRGKDDRVDAERLCTYCLHHADTLKSSRVVSEAVLQLKDLYAVRSRLLRQKAAHCQHLLQLKRSESKAVYAALAQGLRPAIQGLKTSLQKIEAAIKELIMGNEALEARYRVLLSVPGVGHVTAVYLICCTNNFSEGVSGKSLACYAGVAPFGKQSGTSIRGRARVHPMANKELKKLLHQGARSVVVHKEEFRSYYERKKAEGKHDLCVINAIKNKILLRVASVVTKGRKYEEKRPAAA
ncbi:IS110 family transposase [Paracnuella aquatica]|uniref:IS110 family transposase n=1 Tax=Paracnuella aquatica TaxID=2268757 RepID=UPI000DEF95E8|nr:IS110 family transposase [Paracnuella aquatica]RPD43372.1 IS110 family transposase [Paracnuella aquatica]